MENPTIHLGGGVVSTPNIGSIEEGRHQSFPPKHLQHHTRHKLKYRHRPKYKAFPIADRTSIHQRPVQADGTRFGDFEMDLIVDPYHHAILTIVERSTNMLFMTRLRHGKKSEPLAKEVRRLLLPYKKHSKTITTDNGPEFAAHKQINEYFSYESRCTQPHLHSGEVYQR